MKFLWKRSRQPWLMAMMNNNVPRVKTLGTYLSFFYVLLLSPTPSGMCVSFINVVYNPYIFNIEII